MKYHVEEYKTLSSWDDKVVYVRNAKRRVGKNRELMRVFREEVCKFNSQQRLNDPIRSVFTGRLITPGSWRYVLSLKRCNIIHHHLECYDVGKSQILKDPISGRQLKRTNKNIRNFVRKCINRAK